MVATESGRPVGDEVSERSVRSSTTLFEGHVWDVRRDHVDLGDGQDVVRDVLVHPGAVGIICLDEEERVLLVQQYRHPTGRLLWEPPAGLLDVDGEPPLETAKRELWEEAGHRAQTWHVLVDYYNSPGGSTEAFRCYLARGLDAVEDHERHVGADEERDMPIAWVALDEAVSLVLAGRLHNPTTVMGVLAAAAARERGWSGLRPADAPWPERFPDV